MKYLCLTLLLLVSACSIERASLFVRNDSRHVTQEQFNEVIGVVAARLESLEAKDSKGKK